MFGKKKEIRDLGSAISHINEQFEKGITSIDDESYFIRKKTKLFDLPTLLELLSHPIRDVRKDAFDAIKSISTKGLSGKLFKKRIRIKMEAAIKDTRDFELFSGFKYWSLKLK